MAFREVSVYEVREVLRVWLGAGGAGRAPGLRTIAARSGVDRKTVRRYVEAAQAAGLRRSDPPERIDDALVGAVVAAVRPARPAGHGAAWEALVPFEEQIRAWVSGEGDTKPLSVTKIEVLLTRQGCVVPYRTLHRFATERCGFGSRETTVRVVDGDPGVECQLDFGYMGMLDDPETGRRRKVHALIFTACYSRHQFVWLTFPQTLAAVIAGCEAAWEFFGGVFHVVIPDNMSAVVAECGCVESDVHGGVAGLQPARRSGNRPGQGRVSAGQTSGCILHLIGLMWSVFVVRAGRRAWVVCRSWGVVVGGRGRVGGRGFRLCRCSAAPPTSPAWYQCLTVWVLTASRSAISARVSMPVSRRRWRRLRSR